MKFEVIFQKSGNRYSIPEFFDEEEKAWDKLFSDIHWILSDKLHKDGEVVLEFEENYFAIKMNKTINEDTDK